MQHQLNKKGLIETTNKPTRKMVYPFVFTIGCIVILIISGFDLKQDISKPKQAGKSTAKKVSNKKSVKSTPANTQNVIWKAPDDRTIPADKTGETIRYGRELLAHTAKYFGPKGSIAQITNGMNCQNCHLDGGSKLFANNYAGFVASYPKLSNRSGKITNPADRIAECFERSLAGRVPDTAGREVQAMLAYMKWLGKGVKKNQKLFGNSIEKLAYLEHAADPIKGKAVFIAKCQSCHGVNGQGIAAADGLTYIYPPLWGNHSYNDGAGMYRLSNFAGFVKNNMPYGATYKNPQLSNEEAWNVAAFVNSQPRPHRDQHMDWTDLKKKPIDFPFGPYLDAFSETQHKYGPFKPIKDAQDELINK